MALATLDGVPLPFDPDDVRWDGFVVKTHIDNTIGGRVVQVLGVRIGDMVISGSFGKGGWEAQEGFARQVRQWVNRQTVSKGRDTLRFVYAVKNWDLTVLVKGLRDNTGAGAVVHDLEVVAPRYALTLFVVQDNVGNVTKAIKDAYISRLVEGVGWKFSAQYNGPEQSGTVGNVLAEFQAAASGTPTTTVPSQ